MRFQCFLRMLLIEIRPYQHRYTGLPKEKDNISENIQFQNQGVMVIIPSLTPKNPQSVTAQSFAGYLFC